MKKVNTRTLLVVAAGIALAACVFIYQRQGASTSGRETLVGSPTTQPRDRAGNVAVRSRVLDAKSASALVSSLGNANSRGEEVYLRLQLAQMCEGWSVAVDSARQKSESSKAVAAFTRKFCAGYSGTVSTEQAALASLPDDDPYQVTYGLSAELFDAAGQGASGIQDADVIIKQLDEVMFSKGSGMASLMAAETLHQVGAVSSKTIDFAKAHNLQLNQAELTEVQLLSTQMRVCRTYGGCGAEELLTMRLCSEQGRCAEGASMDAVWRRTVSPNVYSAAQRMTSSR